jgi:predicted nucleic acid-binding Zn ribbon protein
MQSVSELLPSLLRNFGSVSTLATPVWRALWRAKVGPSASLHTEVTRFEHDTLTIVVTHHAWHQQLLRMENDLIAALNEAVGRKVLTHLRFVYRDGKTSAAGSPPPAAP